MVQFFPVKCFNSVIEKLEKWKKSKDRKPLVIFGARQVGKTWLMKEFGTKNYGVMDGLYSVPFI